VVMGTRRLWAIISPTIIWLLASFAAQKQLTGDAAFLENWKKIQELADKFAAVLKFKKRL